MRKSDQKRDYKPIKRTSQIVFGERQHLRVVLESIRKFRYRDDRGEKEAKQLETLIAARTAELDAIAGEWDKRMAVARDARTSPDALAEMAQKAPADDYLLLRTISEHPNTPSSVLALLARHSYDAIKENVARHPNADAQTLELLAADPERPLWFLVACNQSAPALLREKLRKRMEAAEAAE
jgi:hypothetical protein